MSFVINDVEKVTVTRVRHCKGSVSQFDVMRLNFISKNGEEHHVKIITNKMDLSFDEVLS